jgi:PAS domain S-box-containing protein
MDISDGNRLVQDLRQQVQALAESEEWMRSVFNHVVDGIITTNEHGEVTTFNAAAERIFGYAAQEVIGQNIKMLMPEPYYGEHDGYIANYIRTGQAKVIGFGREVVGRRKDGSVFPMDLAISEFRKGQTRCFTGIIRDITQRKRAEEQVREADERVLELTAHIHEVLWVIDAKESKVLYISRGYEQMWGRSCQSLIDNPKSYMEGVHPLDQEMMICENDAMLKTGFIDVECRVLRPDGCVRWVWIRGYPVLEKGQIVRLVGIIEDITEKKRLAMERDALLSRFQLHIERLPLAYVLFDNDLRIIDWNLTAEQIFGYTKEEMLGTEPPFEKFVPRSFRQETQAILSRIRLGDVQAHSTNENLTKDGRTITCNWFNTPLLDDDGNFTGLLCLAQDVTERKALEAQFLQAQKMEVVGQLAGGVAHDFNNLQAVIMSCCQLLDDDAPFSGNSRELVEDIYKAASRAANLTRQLLAFSRQERHRPRVLNLNEVVTDAITFLDHVIGEDVALHSNFCANLWPAKIDDGQMNQVIMNLAVNARDAMANGGTLTIETANVEVDEAYLQARQDVKTGSYVVLSISDTGCGMDEKTKARIFEPFFTTKEAGKGTGLGLATVFGIVKQSGGHIAVHSKVGKGTTFKVYLPKHEAAVEAHTENESQRALSSGEQTVMVVDDEDAIRNFACRILQSEGYTVLQARNGEEALRLYERHESPIHLLLTDVMMPKMGGRQLYDQLRVAQPDLNVLFMSGCTEGTVLRQGVLENETTFIEKPFLFAALATAVRDALNQHA